MKRCAPHLPYFTRRRVEQAATSPDYRDARSARAAVRRVIVRRRAERTT